MDAAKDAKTIKRAASMIDEDATTVAERDLARVLAAVGQAMAGLSERLLEIDFDEALQWATVCTTALNVAMEYVKPEPRPDYLDRYPAHMTQYL